MPAYTIKPLEWEDHHRGSFFVCRTVFGNIFVQPDIFKRSEVFGDSFHFKVESVEAGKAKAQEWYLNRLLTALEEAKGGD